MKKAFTLAEVLITLGIIGVVAALTMPALIAKYHEKETVVKLKKVYSVLSQAYQSASYEEGTPDNWNLYGMCSTVGAQNILDKFAPHLNISKNCGVETGCFPDVVYTILNGSNDTNYERNGGGCSKAKIRLSDGTLAAFDVRDVNCGLVRSDTGMSKNICGVITIDINGFKPPNQNGRDAFQFYLCKDGIVPMGTPDASAGFSFDTCLVTGYNCTAWVIYNENMDYLHCDNLSWDGKTKCK